MQEDGTKHWVFQGQPFIPDWPWKDGNKAVYFRDKDGMLTGTVDAAVVPNFPLYKGPECLVRPDWGDLMICPYRYIKVRRLKHLRLAIDCLGKNEKKNSLHSSDSAFITAVSFRNN